MYHNIVLAYDGTSVGQQTLLDSDEVAQWGSSVRWLVAVIAEPLPAQAASGYALPVAFNLLDRNRYAHVLDSGVQRLARVGVAVQSALLCGNPVDLLADFATQVQASLIVVGHQACDSRAPRWWHGSVSCSLVEKSPCNLLCLVRSGVRHQMMQAIDL